MKPSAYQPPFTITPEILNRVAGISEVVGRLAERVSVESSPCRDLPAILTEDRSM